ANVLGASAETLPFERRLVGASAHARTDEADHAKPMSSPGSASTLIVNVVAPTSEIQKTEALPSDSVGMTWIPPAAGVRPSPWLTATDVEAFSTVAVPCASVT